MIICNSSLLNAMGYTECHRVHEKRRRKKTQNNARNKSLADNLHLFLGSEVGLVGSVIDARGSSLLTSAGIGRPDTAGAGVSAGGDVLGGSAVAVALTGRAGTARAPRSGDGVLGGSLVARAVKGGLLATTAGCLSGTDADVTLAAAGGCLGSLGGHFDCWLVVRYGRASEC